ncbi:hypothetical protein WA026_008637 [Henosepilachna vigintioctopunctata]|uniref:Uncharacterized protein n=1 Tax=Henosepilachna vigintioctopunctata TaxID=420089 RepID=A0AAW1U8P2_9CUCU
MFCRDEDFCEFRNKKRRNHVCIVHMKLHKQNPRDFWRKLSYLGLQTKLQSYNGMNLPTEVTSNDISFHFFNVARGINIDKDYLNPIQNKKTNYYNQFEFKLIRSREVCNLG